MGFKMGGFSAFTKQTRQGKASYEDEKIKEELLPSEMKGTHTYKGDDIREKIADIEDRIEFINNDIDDKATDQQRKDLAKLHKQSVELRKQLKKNK